MRLSTKIPVSTVERSTMQFQKLGNNLVKCYETTFKDSWGSIKSKYYITVHENPSELVTLLKDTVLILCTCPDFTIGRPKNLINPFKDPCKHIVELKNWAGYESMCTAEDILEEIQTRR
tara:strand:+ start:7714 stop:8070 length:357 start_codon:yes stop_codon:yes gene_type:complete